MLSATTVPPIYYITSTGRPENEKDAKPPWIEEDYEDHQIIVKHAQTTLQPFPTQATHRPQVIYENYNPKYNTYDKEPEPKSPVNVEGGKYFLFKFNFLWFWNRGNPDFEKKNEKICTKRILKRLGIKTSSSFVRI